MFDKIFTKLNDFDRFKSNPNNFKLAEDFIIYIFFNDDREFAEKEVRKLRKQVNSDKEFWSLFFMKYKFPNIFNSFGKITEISNFSDVILTVANIEDKSKEVFNYSERDKEILKRFIYYYRLRYNDILKMVSYQFQIPLELLNKQIRTKLFFTSKKVISDEFGVNKRTFNKWLVIVGLGDKYKGKKRIYFDEYIEIFTALFLSKSEKLDLNNSLETYRKRIEKGMKFSKSDIANLSSSDIKTQKDNLRKIDKYNLGNIFSYSVTKLFVEKMGSEIDF